MPTGLRNSDSWVGAKETCLRALSRWLDDWPTQALRGALETRRPGRLELL
jgi:hypothetical protein